MKSKLAITLASFAISATAGAADFTNFPPDDTPYGYIAPLGVNQYNISAGTGVVYRPWFHNTDFYGELKAHPVSSTGVINTASTATGSWSASVPAFGSRIMVNGANSNADYCASATGVTAYLCGDQSGEGASVSDYRQRASVLGDIIHSKPAYVGKPSAGYTDFNYPTWAASKAARTARVFVGANDGMMHAFDASNGEEIWAYIPDNLKNNLSDLAPAGNTVYGHKYYVDGQTSVGDAYIGGAWKTILVGGLGAGGKGFYALDITDPVTNISSAQTKPLWNFPDTNMGFSYGKPIIARVNNGGSTVWAAILSNGYDNDDGGSGGDGHARLYIRNLSDGTAIGSGSIQLTSNGTYGVAGKNGLSSPTAIDKNDDGVIDYVYAGDLDGNLWKINLADAASPSSAVLFTATDGSNVQSIITAPDIAKHPSLSGYMVYVATAGLITSGGPVTLASKQSVYGVLDDGVSTGITRSDLVTQTLSTISSGWKKSTNNGFNRTADNSTCASTSDGAIDWSCKKGWLVDLANSQHVYQDLLVRDKRLQFAVNDAASTWLMQLNYLNGGEPTEVVFDRTGNGIVDAEDNPNYTNSSSPGDIAVAKEITGTLVSRPVVVRSGSMDYSLLNIWSENNLSNLPIALTPVCKMLYIDLRYEYSMDKIPTWKTPSDHSDGYDETNGQNGTYDITFTGYVDQGDGTTVTRDVSVSNIYYQDGQNYNITACDDTAGCTHGSGGNTGTSEIDFNLFKASDGAVFSTTSNGRGNGGSGDTAYDGLSFDFSGTDLHRSNRSFDFAIQFDSIYALKHFKFEFDFHPPSGSDVITNSVERIEAEMVNCDQYGESGASDDETRVVKDGFIEDDISEVGINWDVNTQTLALDNRTGLTFETAVANGGGGGGGGGTPTDGSADSEGASGPDDQKGRISWRELLF
ncbi:MAG: PilC/PilY family type IV pilus protein [Motiliproteus sp.]